MRLAVSVVFAALVAGCSGGSGGGGTAVVAVNETQRDGGEWKVLASYGNEVEGFATLAEMGRIADVVVIAQATGVDGVRTAGPDGEAGVELVQIRFAVIRAISDWDEKSIVLEIDMPSGLGIGALEEQVAGFPPALIAARHKGRDEVGRYRLVNSQSLWTEQPGGGLFGAVAQDDNALALAATAPEVETLDELGDHLEAARRECEPECGRPQAAGNR